MTRAVNLFIAFAICLGVALVAAFVCGFGLGCLYTLYWIITKEGK